MMCESVTKENKTRMRLTAVACQLPMQHHNAQKAEAAEQVSDAPCRGQKHEHNTL